MPRKVFISFLGTNNYVLCRYDIGEAAPVRFVQEALIEHFCKEWSEDDRILIFCTSKEKTGENGSKEINWFDNGQPRVTDESEKIGLQHRLQDLKARIGLKAQIEEHDIKAGFTEEEIWDIFDTVYAEEENGITAYRLYGDQLLAFDFIRDGEDGLSLDFALQIVGSANELWTDDFGFYEEGDEADPFAG